MTFVAGAGCSRSAMPAAGEADAERLGEPALLLDVGGDQERRGRATRQPRLAEELRAAVRSAARDRRAGAAPPHARRQERGQRRRRPGIHARRRWPAGSMAAATAAAPSRRESGSLLGLEREEPHAPARHRHAPPRRRPGAAAGHVRRALRRVRRARARVGLGEERHAARRGPGRPSTRGWASSAMRPGAISVTANGPVPSQRSPRRRPRAARSPAPDGRGRSAAARRAALSLIRIVRASVALISLHDPGRAAQQARPDRRRRGAERMARQELALEARRRRGHREGRAVVEAHAVAQPEGPRQAVRDTDHCVARPASTSLPPSRYCTRVS